MEPDLMGDVRRQWRSKGRSLEAVEAMTRFSVSNPDLGLNCRDLCDLVAELERGSSRPLEERVEILSRLLEGAGDPLLREALLVSLLPAVVTASRVLARKGLVDPEESNFNAVFRATATVLSEWAGQRRKYAGGDVVNAASHRIRREILMQRQMSRRTVGGSALDNVGPITPSLSAETLLDLIEAGDEQVGKMVRERVNNGTPWKEIGVRFGLSGVKAEGMVREAYDRVCGR